MINFNPRTREGCDLLSFQFRLHCLNFNPRTREGCDILGALLEEKDIIFQSTHPRRVRRGALKLIEIHYIIFQSTHPRRVRRFVAVCNGSKTTISIHAPAKGATGKSKKKKKFLKLFQSTHPRRVRHSRCYGANTIIDISIHAPAKGAT